MHTIKKMFLFLQIAFIACSCHSFYIGLNINKIKKGVKSLGHAISYHHTFENRAPYPIIIKAYYIALKNPRIINLNTEEKITKLVGNYIFHYLNVFNRKTGERIIHKWNPRHPGENNPFLGKVTFTFSTKFGGPKVTYMKH
jgi:hypothetical protein